MNFHNPNGKRWIDFIPSSEKQLMSIEEIEKWEREKADKMRFKIIPKSFYRTSQNLEFTTTLDQAFEYTRTHHYQNKGNSALGAMLLRETIHYASETCEYSITRIV